MTTTIVPDRIMQIGLGFWDSKALLSATELGVFTELAKGPLSAEELAKRTGIHQRSARDFFDTLVAMGMLDRKEGLYSNTPETNTFLDKSKPSYVGGMLEMANARLYPAWGNLTDALRSGLPQNGNKKGGDYFEELYKDPERLSTFARAMTGVSMGASKVIAQKFPWKDYKTFIDIGTAQGNLPVQVALANPHLTGGGLDLPPVKPIFEEYVSSYNLSDRLRFITCDINKEPFPAADVLILGHMLHGVDINGKQETLKKAYDALPKGGSVIIHESLLDEERRKNTFGFLMSLNMLVETPGGFEFTGSDCCQWLKKTGFSQTRVEPLLGPDSMAVGVK